MSLYLHKSQQTINRQSDAYLFQGFISKSCLQVPKLLQKGKFENIRGSLTALGLQTVAIICTETIKKNIYFVINYFQLMSVL